MSQTPPTIRPFEQYGPGSFLYEFECKPFDLNDEVSCARLKRDLMDFIKTKLETGFYQEPTVSGNVVLTNLVRVLKVHELTEAVFGNEKNCSIEEPHYMDGLSSDSSAVFFKIYHPHSYQVVLEGEKYKLFKELIASCDEVDFSISNDSDGFYEFQMEFVVEDVYF